MQKGEPDDTDRDQQILSRLARIEHRVDSLDQTTAFALRADAERHFDSVRLIFGASKRRAQVYLAANGAMSVQELALHLGMKRQNVGIELKVLGNEGLLELIDTQQGRDIWAKKALDRTLRISVFLREHFSLNGTGKPDKDSRKRKAR